MNTPTTSPSATTTASGGYPASRVSTAPAPARTDAGHAPLESAPPALPVGTPDAPPTVSARTVRRLAAPLVVGALAWATSSITLGFNTKDPLGITVQDLTGFAFQVGIMSLVVLQLRTRATGTGRGARIMLRVEQGLLSLAMLWSLVHGLVPAARDAGWLAVLDIFWPLSMLGMFVIGIKVAITGRWRGAARVWPLVAESWAPVSVPTFVIIGGRVADVVGSVHLLIGYVTLGLILLARPHLVGARD